MSQTTTATILGPPTGTAQQAIAYLTPRVSEQYPGYDVRKIVHAYVDIGGEVGLDWFLAIAQMAHETGSLTSWWSQRPRRNPAGLGVTGRKSQRPRGDQPGPGWSWDDRENLWREGWTFATWAYDAIPAHLGRLLAYALPEGRGTPAQQAAIRLTLAYRPLPAGFRGAAVLWTGLNGRWAVPGKTYAQRILKVAEAMRAAS
jgi:hypothetical protein